jgi:hypothetical protein
MSHLYSVVPRSIVGRVSSSSEKFAYITADDSTHALTVIDYEHHEVHAGSMYGAYDHTANIGAIDTPTDAIQLTFLTPAVKEVHMVIHAKSSVAALYKFTEAYTAEGTNGDTVTAYNKDRNSSKTSGMAIENKADVLVTGGILLETQTLTSAKFGSGESRSSQEWILKKSTLYAVSLYLDGAGIATISLGCYEHTNKG